MKILTFLNGKGLIYGRDPKRIECDRGGILKIGDTEIEVSSRGDSVLPVLFHGATVHHSATFTDEHGEAFDLGMVDVKNGRITSPHPFVVEIAELRSRIEVLESENAVLREKNEELSHIFDTNSLNFLIG